MRKKVEIPVVKLRKSAVLKIAGDRETRSVIVFNEAIGKMFLMRDTSQSHIPGLWWHLSGMRAKEWADRNDVVLRFKQNNEAPLRVDDTLPYKRKKDVICEIVMVEDDEPNEVDPKVWGRVRE